MVGVDDVVADSQVGHRRERSAHDGLGGAPPVHQLAPRVDGELQRGRDEALGHPRLGEVDARLRRQGGAEHLRLDALQVEAGALGLAAVVERDDHLVAGPQLALELRLGLADRARGRGGRLGTDRDAVVLGRDRPQPQASAPRERLGHVHVEAPGVGVVHRRGHVLPVGAQRGLDLLGSRDQEGGVVRDQVERRAERRDRQELGEIRSLAVVQGRLGQEPVLGRELGRGRELDLGDLAEGALGEGREPANRLDLVSEQLEPGGALLGGREDVHDVAARRKLAALLDLVDPLVAGLHQELRGEGEVDLLTRREREPLRPKRRVRHRLRQRDGAGDHHGGLPRAGADEGVERGDPQAHEVRRRRDVRGVAGPARWVVVDSPRSQVGAQLACEVAGADVVRSDNHHRRGAQRVRIVGESGDQVGLDGRRGVGFDRLGPRRGSRERAECLIRGGELQQRAQCHGRQRLAGPTPLSSDSRGDQESR